MTAYQTFLPDCNCKNGGILFKDNIPHCRWCLKPWGHGGIINYNDESFKQSHTQKSKQYNKPEWNVNDDVWFAYMGKYYNGTISTVYHYKKTALVFYFEGEETNYLEVPFNKLSKLPPNHSKIPNYRIR